VAGDDLSELGDLFRLLAEVEFHGSSPLYERLCIGAAEEPEILAMLLQAAPADRMPHLLFGAMQFLLLVEGTDPIEQFGTAPFEHFRTWCLDRRPEIENLVAARFTQTNEVGRCAALLPTLSTVAQLTGLPLALLEVGASAGLNLLLDRYRYVYRQGEETGKGDAEVVLCPRLRGTTIPPLSVPIIAWRMGLDRHPVDVYDEEAVTWLRSCIWPEQRWRIELFERAVSEARKDPARVSAGDAVESLAQVVHGVPENLALCIVHTAVINYLPDPVSFTQTLVDLSASRPIWWVSGEAQGMVRELPQPPPPGGEALPFLYGVVPLGVEGHAPRTLALARSHGTWIEWLE
jgi:Uncharacterized protein conserved in bacteria (DUF2332)